MRIVLTVAMLGTVLVQQRQIDQDGALELRTGGDRAEAELAPADDPPT